MVFLGPNPFELIGKICTHGANPYEITWTMLFIWFYNISILFYVDFWEELRS